jgi:chromosome segregation ATPase
MTYLFNGVQTLPRTCGTLAGQPFHTSYPFGFGAQPNPHILRTTFSDRSRCDGGSPRIMTTSILIDRSAIRDKFRQWDEGHQPLEAELNESLAALSALQAHLDAWQRELARERESLQVERESLQAQRETLVQDQPNAGQDPEKPEELTNELTATRDKASALTSMLLSRTEELRVLDSRRAELVTELELSRAREKDLKVSLDEIRQEREEDRAKWGEETRRLRELLEHRLETSQAAGSPPRPEPVSSQAAPARPVERPAERQPAENAVFASVMEQFGKLRQQRAMGNALKKGR